MNLSSAIAELSWTRVVIALAIIYLARVLFINPGEKRSANDDEEEETFQNRWPRAI